MLKRKGDMKWSEAFPLIMDNSILDADTADLIEKMPTVVVDNGFIINFKATASPSAYPSNVIASSGN